MAPTAAAALGLGLLVSFADAARHIRASHDSSLAIAAEPKGPNFGAPGCECIGIDWANATVEVDIGDDMVWYPRSIGSSCKAWDNFHHPKCEGKHKHKPSWCMQSWCFVDGCSCNLTSPPKTSAYLPKVSSLGGKIYYSYATCGGKDEWTEKHHKHACVDLKTEDACKKLKKCAWAGEKKGCLGKELAKGCKAKSQKLFGKSNCQCIGFANLSGTTTVTIKEKEYEYPADFGSYCSDWDAGNHPSCGENKSASWCSKSWCYVDPCSCDLKVTPKKLTYVSSATYQGKPLFYSYSACGAKDSYTKAENAKACPNFHSESECKEQDDCAWLSSKCMHKDLQEVCSKPKETSKKEKEPEPEPEPNSTGAPKKSGAEVSSLGLPALAVALSLAAARS